MLDTDVAARVRDLVAVVGIGATDHRTIYQAARRPIAGAAPYTHESLRADAFGQALNDAQLAPDDIDGVFVASVGDHTSAADAARLLGLRAPYVRPTGPLVSTTLTDAVTAIAAGRCQTAALVYSATTRLHRSPQSASTSAATPSSYYYHRPWGWTSQPAHWAVMFNRYRVLFGIDEHDLGRVAITLRRNAALRPGAIMTNPLTMDDYLAAECIVRPLRVFDLCLISDGGMCLIVTSRSRARDRPQPPVVVSGLGHARVPHSKLRAVVAERLLPQFRAAADAALAMAGLCRTDVDFFQGYDSSSVHLLNQIEGYGFVAAGETLARWADGDMEIGGTLPVNTSGGMLSEVYLHGWSQVAETVAQLRHQADRRQIRNARVGFASVATTDEAHPMIFRRGI